MAEAFELVRTIRLHLRRSATLLDSGKFDEALAAADSALALDPQSVPAQALRERIVAAKGSASGAGPVRRANEQRPFVPHGVSAASWRGFEQRITERRFKALLDTINTSIVAGDADAARAALVEARELRPDAPVLPEFEARIAAVPAAPPAPAETHGGRIWMRAMGAAALFLVGVSLLLGLEWMRPGVDTNTPVAPAVAPEVPAAAPAQDAGPAPMPELGPVPVALADEEESVPAVVTPPEPLLPEATSGNAPSEPVGAAPAPRQRSQPARLAPETAVATRQVSPPMVPRAAPPVQAGEAPRNMPVTEVADDYVAPRAATVITDAGPAVVLSEPAVDTPVNAASRDEAEPPPAAMASAISIPPTVDQQVRVQEVLRRYARAYDQLDATAARAVYATVDERALARAFQNLSSQKVSFNACDIDIRGAVANASCRGQLSYAPKVGNREPRTEERTWRFELRRQGESWTIAGVDMRRAPTE